MALCTTASTCELPPTVKLMMSKSLAHEASHWVWNVHFYRDTSIINKNNNKYMISIALHSDRSVLECFTYMYDQRAIHMPH